MTIYTSEGLTTFIVRLHSYLIGWIKVTINMHFTTNTLHIYSECLHQLDSTNPNLQDKSTTVTIIAATETPLEVIRSI
jgi:hypothetical protein